MLFAEATQTAYVPISTGCSQFCAYCIVPYARGLEKNRDKEDVMKEVEAQVANGASEIVLLGQIVNKHPDFDENSLMCVKELNHYRRKYLENVLVYEADELSKI